MSNVSPIRKNPAPHLTTADREAIARAFGFQSENHMGNVLAGREPSALEGRSFARWMTGS